MPQNEKERKVSWKTTLSYGLGDLYGGGSFFIIMTFSMYYLVNVMGMLPLLAGLIPAIGKIWDAVSDPMMGYISDNTPKNRFGKRRVWILISIIPIAVTFTLIWYPTNIESQYGKFIFYAIAYLLYFTVETVAYIPYAALSAEMTQSFTERNKLNSSRIIFSFISTLIGGLLASPIIDAFNGSKMGYFVMACVFGLLYAIPWIPLYFNTWELQTTEQPKKSNVSFMKNFLSLFKNKSCRIQIAMYVGSFGALDLFMSLALFFLIDYLNKTTFFFVICQGSLLITMMAMIPFYNKTANKKGHGTAYIIGLSIFAFGLLLMLFQTPTTNPILLIINLIILGGGLSAGCLIPHQLLPFVSDIDTLITGKSRAGTYSAAMTLTRKLFLGLMIMPILGIMLSQIGYKQPVPSILTDLHFKEGRDLASLYNQDASVLESYYTKLPDGNWHLKYISESPNRIVASIVKLQKANNALSEEAMAFFNSSNTYDRIPKKIFEEYIIPSLSYADYKKAHERFIIENCYVEENGSYVVTKNPEAFMTRSNLYDLKIFLEKIKYRYSGLGEVQKPLQKDRTLVFVKMFFIFLPFIMVIIGLLAARKFKVTPETHALIIEESKRLDNGGSMDEVDPKVKLICEQLTGIPYENLRSEK